MRFNNAKEMYEYLNSGHCYLLCCLDDENYASAQYFTFSSMTEAKEFCYQFAEENYPD